MIIQIYGSHFLQINILHADFFHQERFSFIILYFVSANLQMLHWFIDHIVVQRISLGFQAGGESLTNYGFLLLFGIDVEPGLGVQLGDEVGPEGKVLSGA